MHAICPITDKRINETVARFNGVVTTILVISFLALNFWGGVLFMLIDFAIRGFIDSKYSPVCFVNKTIVKQLKLSGKMVNSGPKIFAAQVGIFLTAITLLSYFSGNVNLAYVFAGILGFFSFLEAAFNICVACKLYPLIRRKNS